MQFFPKPIQVIFRNPLNDWNTHCVSKTEQRLVQ